MQLENFVSIGMPVYNGEKYIRQALDSLLAQDHGNFELIISDNASDDNTQEICLSYTQKDTRIQYHRNDQNLGAIVNFSKVLKLSHAQYFMWAACDDLWDSTFISTLLSYLTSNEHVVLAMAETQYKLSNGMNLPFFAEGKGFYQLSGNESQLNNLLKIPKYNYGNLIYGLYRKKVLFNKAGKSILDDVSSLNSLNENPVFLHVASQGSIIVSPKILFYKTVPSLKTYLYAAREYNFFPSLDDNILRFDAAPFEDSNHGASSGVIKKIKRSLGETFSIAKYHWQAWLDIQVAVFKIEAVFFE